VETGDGAVPVGIGPEETITFAEAIGRHDEVSVDPEDVSGELVVWEATTVAEVLAEVRDYFAAVEDPDFGAPSDESIVDSWFDFSYLDHYEVVSREWVDAPFGYVSILYDDAENEHRSHVNEPVLDDFERYVRRDLVDLLRNNLMYQEFDNDGEPEAVFRREAKCLIADHAATVEDGNLHKLLYYLLRDFIHYGSIDPIMRDGATEDVSCDGTNVPVFVYLREYRDLQTNVSFGRDRLDSFTFRLAQRAGKQLSVSNPLVDASLPNGSRVQLTLGGEVSTRSSSSTPCRPPTSRSSASTTSGYRATSRSSRRCSCGARRLGPTGRSPSRQGRATRRGSSCSTRRARPGPSQSVVVGKRW
jgi:flagellar protein FlaI